MTIKLYHGDCLHILPTLDANSVDTVISDLPAGINFMGRKWDNKTGYTARSDKGRRFLECGELLGMEPWEVGFVAFVIDCLVETYRVMKPGAMCLLWALPRTADLTGLAMRVAGLEVRNVVTHLFGAGFPKSLDISKALDKAAGVEREAAGHKPGWSPGRKPCKNWRDREGRTDPPPSVDKWETLPATPAAVTWSGYGTGLKPAVEFWLLGMKPREGTFAANALAWGCAGLNVDGSRIPTGASESLIEIDPLLSVLDSVSFDTPESCRDWLLHIHAALMLDNRDSKAQVHDVSDLGGTLPAGALYGLLATHLYPNGIWCGLNLNEVLNSQFDCLPDLHLYGELVRMVQAVAQDGATSLADALEHISRFQSEPLHIHGSDSGRPSSYDVFLCVQALCYLLKELYTCPKYTPQTHKSQGRFPSNLILSHHVDCVQVGTRRVKSPGMKRGTAKAGYKPGLYEGSIGKTRADGYADPNGYETIPAWRCHPDCPIRELGEQSGTHKGSAGARTNHGKGNNCYGEYETITTQADIWGDTGTAARYFLNLPGEARFFYSAKASRRERDAGLDDFYWRKDKSVPFGFVRISRAEWETLPKKQRAQGNVHPTVKPLKLLEYLCTLTCTPAGGVVLDFCMGTCTAGVACVNTGRDFIGIEKGADSFDIAEARIEHAQQKARQLELI
jgi:DNA modification methylase